MTDAMNDSQTCAINHELVLERLIDAPPSAIYRAWTEPALLMQWFCPKPWSVASAELDVRPGGAQTIVMRSPEGQEFPNTGMYLEVVENERIVWTDAYIGDWQPSAKAFMTGIITLTPEGEKTLYRAVVRHWSDEDKKSHENMGFYEGWGKATDQLEALVATLK